MHIEPSETFTEDINVCWILLFKQRRDYWMCVCMCVCMCIKLSIWPRRNAERRGHLDGLVG